MGLGGGGGGGGVKHLLQQYNAGVTNNPDIVTGSVFTESCQFLLLGLDLSEYKHGYGCLLLYLDRIRLQVTLLYSG